MKKTQSLGKGGHCYCPKCQTLTEHNAGIPCQQTTCPVCGAKMLRKGSHHYDLLMKKRGEANSIE